MADLGTDSALVFPAWALHGKPKEEVEDAEYSDSEDGETKHKLKGKGKGKNRPLSIKEAMALTCKTLIDLREAIPKLKELNGWDEEVLRTDTDLREVRLVGVDVDTAGKVTSIFLPNQELEGYLPNSIGNLQDLKKLRLENNKLSGTLPHSLYTLQHLTWLWVNNNRFHGELPPKVGDASSLTNNLPKLESLHVQHNKKLGGAICIEFMMKMEFKSAKVHGCYGGLGGRIDMPFLVGLSAASEDIPQLLNVMALKHPKRVHQVVQLEKPTTLGKIGADQREPSHRCELQNTLVRVLSNGGLSGPNANKLLSPFEGTYWHLEDPLAFGEKLDGGAGYHCRRAYFEEVDEHAIDALPQHHEFRGVDINLVCRYRPWQRFWLESLEGLCKAALAQGERDGFHDPYLALPSFLGGKSDLPKPSEPKMTLPAPVYIACHAHNKDYNPEEPVKKKTRTEEEGGSHMAVVKEDHEKVDTEFFRSKFDDKGLTPEQVSH
jgi:hypothetical protein